ncbi:MAG: hypothetical protein LBN06_01380 [Prevotellaceae bacterium]|jgi:hypothetical protein|nr:hypothetical protein [Prevotellaceae bacterium]
MRIESLINRYFDGQTSCDEERELRSFFASGQEVPEHLLVYRPLFVCLEQEVQTHRNESKQVAKSVVHHRLYYILGTVAAVMLLLTGITGIVKYHRAAMPADYVIIDGKRYTDVNLIREKALDAFQEIQTSPEELYEWSTVK